MPIMLYYTEASPHCQAVEMTAEHLGIPLVKKHLDIFAGEHMKPEFLKINPAHCVPTIDDDGFILWESRAIMPYLVNKCAPDSLLYPKDPKARAIVDKMLYYDIGTLNKTFMQCYLPHLEQSQPIDPEKAKEFKTALSIFEKILEKTPYAAGKHLTLADYSMSPILVAAELINPVQRVPTIDDDGFVLWESRAIMTYLVHKYAPDSPLYPKDLKARAIVDKILYYDNGTFFKALVEYYSPQIYENKPKDPEKEKEFKASLSIFEKLLEKTPYLAGKYLTLADYSIFASLVFAEVLIDFDFSEFPKISGWLQRIKKETPKFKEINEVPLRKFKEMLEAKGFIVLSEWKENYPDT